MKKCVLITMLSALSIVFASCSAPQYLALPSQLQCPVIQNTGTFSIQNLDEQAKVENNNLICHYDGFDIKYTFSDDFNIAFTIINNTNKDLLIDKSQCYVLYNGNASPLFKDLRLTGNTTFNDVQGAINNVQTGHGSVMMTIPSYSKWSLPINESNVKNIQLPPSKTAPGYYTLSPFDNLEPVEFIIPYSFDPTMREWKTSRNRVYVSSIDAKNATVTVNRWATDKAASIDHGYYRPSSTPKVITTNQYRINKQNGKPDFSEVDRIDAINQSLYDKHNRQVKWGRAIAGVFCLPLPFFSIILWLRASQGCDEHLPPK